MCCCFKTLKYSQILIKVNTTFYRGIGRSTTALSNNNISQNLKDLAYLTGSFLNMFKLENQCIHQTKDQSSQRHKNAKLTYCLELDAKPYATVIFRCWGRWDWWGRWGLRLRWCIIYQVILANSSSISDIFWWVHSCHNMRLPGDNGSEAAEVTLQGSLAERESNRWWALRSC